MVINLSDVHNFTIQYVCLPYYEHEYLKDLVSHLDGPDDNQTARFATDKVITFRAYDDYHAMMNIPNIRGYVDLPAVLVCVPENARIVQYFYDQLAEGPKDARVNITLSPLLPP